MSKVNIIDIEHRLTWGRDKTTGIQQYDSDNAYPQRVSSIIDASGMASICTDRYRRFVGGKGFADNIVVNQEGLTLNKLLRELCYDYARFNGFAVHVTYDGLLNPSFDPVPFEWYRLTADPEQEGKIAEYNDWAKLKGKMKKSQVRYLPLFNPDNVEQEIKEYGGIDNYPGQIFYSPGLSYPKSPIDAELESAMTDAEIKDFNYNNITTNFMASHLFLYKGDFESDEEREAYKDSLKQFQGAKKASRILLIDGVTSPEDAPEIKPFTVANYDKLFEHTERSTHDRIRKLYGLPPILVSEMVPGKLGNTTEYKEAVELYNDLTEDDRASISEDLESLFINHAQPKSWEIIPLGNVTNNPG